MLRSERSLEGRALPAPHARTSQTLNPGSNVSVAGNQRDAASVERVWKRPVTKLMREGIAIAAVSAVTVITATGVSLTSTRTAEPADTGYGVVPADSGVNGSDEQAVQAARVRSALEASGMAAFAGREPSARVGNGVRNVVNQQVTEKVAEDRSAALAAELADVEDTQLAAAAQSRGTSIAASLTSVAAQAVALKKQGAVPGQVSTVWLRPVDGPVSSPFGWRSHPIGGYANMHTGVDLSNSCGTPIKAAQAGKVVSVGWLGSAGNALRISHGTIDGKQVDSGYYHAESYVVTVGQTVTRGQVVGYVGTTGNSTGCHLHFLVYVNNQVVDPMNGWIK